MGFLMGRMSSKAHLRELRALIPTRENYAQSSSLIHEINFCNLCATSHMPISNQYKYSLCLTGNASTEQEFLKRIYKAFHGSCCKAMKLNFLFL